ncbi:integumentary mucin A.1 [Girardinichthys multiradiatus]|uniref:integumentary mucin A.1 n=1 Tax=Girardinichthys multiradiatus TaxID=208333 RepID=UPI001FADCA55|nr:integumentary mucin A.1 [Girardinichthys multiradiatus]
MKVQLLLLLALAGPLCSFTRASPTTVPTEVKEEETTIQVVQTMKQDTIITAPSPTDPQYLPELVMASTDRPVPETEAHTVFTTALDPTTETSVVETEAAAVDTSAYAETTLLPAITAEAPVPETTAPEEIGGTLPETTETPANPSPSENPHEETRNGQTGKEVENKDDMVEGDLSTGQIVGIVIGAIMAVVIVTAVVIAVLKRMGKYSP